MKETFKTVGVTISGLFSSAFAGIESIRLSIMQMLFSDFSRTLDFASRIGALVITILSAIYLYFKIKSIILDCKEKERNRDE